LAQVGVLGCSWEFLDMQIADFEYALKGSLLDPDRTKVKPFLRGPGNLVLGRSTTATVSDKELSALSDLFNNYDRDKSLEMALDEVPALFAQMGLPITDVVFKEYLMAQPTLTDGERKESNGIKLEEVHQFYRLVVGQQPDCVKRVASGHMQFSRQDMLSQERTLRHAFNDYDVDNVGTLSMEAVKAVLTDSGMADLDGDKHDAFVKDMFQAMGKDTNSSISFADVVYFCNASVSGAVAARDKKAAKQPPSTQPGSPRKTPRTPRAKPDWSQTASTPRGAMTYKARTPRALY